MEDTMALLRMPWRYSDYRIEVDIGKTENIYRNCPKFWTVSVLNVVKRLKCKWNGKKYGPCLFMIQLFQPIFRQRFIIRVPLIPWSRDISHYYIFIDCPHTGVTGLERTLWVSSY